MKRESRLGILEWVYTWGLRDIVCFRPKEKIAHMRWPSDPRSRPPDLTS
jgi:hypothetical protein